MIRSKSLNLASILVALHPIPPKCNSNERGTTAALKQKQIHSQEVLRKIVELDICPPNMLLTIKKLHQQNVFYSLEASRSV
jgi:hypothetical protein